MKKVILAVACLFSVNAMALDANSSWEQIFNSYKTSFSHGYNMGGIALDNACVTDANVQSKTPVTVCTKWEERYVNLGGESYWETVCAEKAQAIAVSPRTYAQPVCEAYEGNAEAGYVCTKFGQKSVTIPATISVEVFEEHGEVATSFKKDYTLPACNR